MRVGNDGGGKEGERGYFMAKRKGNRGNRISLRYFLRYGR